VATNRGTLLDEYNDTSSARRETIPPAVTLGGLGTAEPSRYLLMAARPVGRFGTPVPPLSLLVEC
jgi:hypothetical protein